MTTANTDLASLYLGLDREKYWDETAQTKIDDTLDYIELRLAVAGLVPYLGTPTSAVLTAITLWRGHYFAAVLSAVGMIPVVGSAANALRATKLGATAATRLAKATNSLSRAVKVAQVTAQGRKFVLYERTLTGGLGSKLVLGAYDLIFCKALHLACFTAGTPIEGRDGPKAIETFRDYETYGDACDWVMSRSEFDPDGPLTVRRVLRKFERHASVIELRLPGGVTIGTTAEHPFYRRGDGWVNAGELRPGDEVQLKDTGWVRVEDVVDTGRYEIVYNLEVEDDHTYFVGCAEWRFSVWSHNKCEGLHHLWPVALGNSIPYGSKLLTWLGKKDHTAIHAAMSQFLRNETKVVGGKSVNMLPGPGNPGFMIIRNFTFMERFDAVLRFHQTYLGGQYLKQFLAEAAEASKRGLLH